MKFMQKKRSQSIANADGQNLRKDRIFSNRKAVKITARRLDLYHPSSTSPSFSSQLVPIALIELRRRPGSIVQDDHQPNLSRTAHSLLYVEPLLALLVVRWALLKLLQRQWTDR